MAERTVVMDTAEETQQAEALQDATDRAKKAEAEVARLRKLTGAKTAAVESPVSPGTAEASTEADTELKQPPSPSSAGTQGSVGEGEAELRNDSMMAHLLDSLAAGKDIGHYGRLVFAMVARHFMSHDEVLSWLTRDRDFSDEDARLMLRQVEGRDYSPPRRDRIVEWHGQQEFPILPHPSDPDCGNLYRNLKFPEEIYRHIGHYQEQKAEAGE